MITELCLAPYDLTDFSQVTPPAETPISLTDAKTYLRVDDDIEDSLIFSLINAATGAAQNFSWLQFITATYKSNIHYLPQHIKLWKNPVDSITSIKYYDENNVQQTLSASDYSFAPRNGCCTIIITKSITTYTRMDAVEIIFVAGFGAATAVPSVAIDAVALTLGHLYEHREDVVMGNAVKLPMGSEYLLNGIQVKNLA